MRSLWWRQESVAGVFAKDFLFATRSETQDEVPQAKNEGGGTFGV